LEAWKSIWANYAELLACGCGCKGEVEIEAGCDISLRNALVRASKSIQIKSADGDVDLCSASLAITQGATGDICVKGDKIIVTDATIKAPDKINLKGKVVGKAAVICHGTEPCPC